MGFWLGTFWIRFWEELIFEENGTMEVVSYVRGELLYVVGLYCRISQGMRDGGLPCDKC